MRATAAAGALLALALWEVWAARRPAADAPTDADWRDAAGFVRARHEPGALLLFAPEWMDPVGRLHLGDLIPLAAAGRLDSARYATLIEVSARDARAPATAGLTPVEERAFGALMVRRFARPAPRVVFDLHRLAEIAEIDYRPRLVRLLRLREGSAPRAIHVRVELGEALVVRAGLADAGLRRANRATARVAVLVDGEERASAIVGSASGWLALPVVATSPGVHDLELRASVEGDQTPVLLDVGVALESRSRP